MILNFISIAKEENLDRQFYLNKTACKVHLHDSKEVILYLLPFPEPLNPPWPVLPDDGQCQWSVHRHLVTRCPGVPRGLGTQHGASDSDRCHGVSPAPSVSRCQDTDIVTISKNPFDSGAI